MRGEHLVQRFREILQQMKAVRNLGGAGRALTGALGIRTRPIPRDHLHPGVLPEPLRHGLGGALREQGHGLAALQVHQDRAIGVPFPQGEIVHPQHPGRGERRGGCRRSRRSRVFRLTARSHAWPRRTPALPPRAMPRATRRWASRSVRRAQGAATVGSRSVKMRRRQARLRQNHLRTRSWRRTRYCAQGRSARVRS